MNIRLLRGQVVIRENLTADTDHYRHIIVPGVSTAHDADAVQRARKWHRGTVLAMGAPMLSKTGAEILPEFKVGDEVLFHWQHREKSWTREWSDGLLACWVPQAYVDAVLEPGDDAKHDVDTYDDHFDPNDDRYRMHDEMDEDPRFGGSR